MHTETTTLAQNPKTCDVTALIVMPIKKSLTFDGHCFQHVKQTQRQGYSVRINTVYILPNMWTVRRSTASIPQMAAAATQAHCYCEQPSQLSDQHPASTTWTQIKYIGNVATNRATLSSSALLILNYTEPSIILPVCFVSVRNSVSHIEEGAKAESFREWGVGKDIWV